MATHLIKVNLDSLNRGALKDLFEKGLSDVLDNIADVNTQADVTRAFTLKVEIKPNKTREQATTKVSMSKTLAPMRASEGSIMFNSVDGLGKVEAYTNKAMDQEFEFSEKPAKEEVKS